MSLQVGSLRDLRVDTVLIDREKTRARRVQGTAGSRPVSGTAGLGAQTDNGCASG